MGDIMEEGSVVETHLEDQEHGGALTRNKKINPIGRTFYGERFEKFDRVAEIKDFIPAFKEFYYAEKTRDFKKTGGEIIREFNETVCYPENKTFFPYTNQLKLWRAKWDRDILENKEVQGMELAQRKQVLQIIKSRDSDNKIVLGMPQDVELEAGARSLGGELLNDAMQMLRDDQDLEEVYGSDELMKRRNYIVNVFSHVTKLVQGKAALMLKASQEKRESANFIMNLMAKATAGRLSDDDIVVLETAYKQPQPENGQPANV